MQKMLVTIITVAFNSEKTIGRTIESVLNQSYENIEYIIVDGASRDGTAEVARSFQAAFDAAEGRSLRVISEPDKGMYDALNKGAALAQGQLVGQINSDDWYEKDAVESMVKLYCDQGYDAAWGRIRIITSTGSMVKHARIGKIWSTVGWCHPAMFSKRELLLEFPYPLETMYDDFDYITAVHCAGRKIVTLDKIISNFTVGGQSTQKGLKEALRRARITYGIHRKYGMSRLYWPYRVAFELAKSLLGG